MGPGFDGLPDFVSGLLGAVLSLVTSEVDFVAGFIRLSGGLLGLLGLPLSLATTKLGIFVGDSFFGLLGLAISLRLTDSACILRLVNAFGALVRSLSASDPESGRWASVALRFRDFVEHSESSAGELDAGIVVDSEEAGLPSAGSAS